MNFEGHFSSQDLHLHLFSACGDLPRLAIETSRVGVIRSQGVRYGTGTIIFDSGELPQEFWYPPLSLSCHKSPTTLPPPLCTTKNSLCTAVYCLYKGLLAALMVPLPPSPPILLETSRKRITREHENHRNKGPSRGPSEQWSVRWPFIAGQPPSPLGRVSMRSSSSKY